MKISTIEAYIRLSTTIGIRQVLADNRGWRIIERGGESRVIELLKSVPMVLMADSESGEYSRVECIGISE